MRETPVGLNEAIPTMSTLRLLTAATRVSSASAAVLSGPAGP